MFVHILSAKGKTVFERHLPAEPDAFRDAVQPFRKKACVIVPARNSWQLRADAHGDPLPAHTLARLGSTRPLHVW